MLRDPLMSRNREICAAKIAELCPFPSLGKVQIV